MSLVLVPLSGVMSAGVKSTCSAMITNCDAAHNRLQTLDELDLVVRGHVAVVAGPQRVGEVGEGRESVDQVVRHVEELELVGGAAEGGAHDQVHLHGRQHGPQGVQLGPELPVCARVVGVQVGEKRVVGLFDCFVK